MRNLQKISVLSLSTLVILLTACGEEQATYQPVLPASLSDEMSKNGVYTLGSASEVYRETLSQGIVSKDFFSGSRFIGGKKLLLLTENGILSTTVSGVSYYLRQSYFLADSGNVFIASKYVNNANKKDIFPIAEQYTIKSLKGTKVSSVLNPVYYAKQITFFDKQNYVFGDNTFMFQTIAQEANVKGFDSTISSVDSANNFIIPPACSNNSDDVIANTDVYQCTDGLAMVNFDNTIYYGQLMLKNVRTSVKYQDRLNSLAINQVIHGLSAYQTSLTTK